MGRLKLQCAALASGKEQGGQTRKVEVAAIQRLVQILKWILFFSDFSWVDHGCPATNRVEVYK